MAVKKKISEKEKLRLDHKVRAESDLEYFINLVHPDRLLGNIHSEIIKWWTASNASSHQLLLLPRDHMKSAMIAYRVVWELTRDPTLRVLYISSTSNLATKQLKFMKDILTSPKYRQYWPEMVNEHDTQREKWTEREISVDHPQRKKEFIRDPSIFTAGLTSNIVGLHCDIAVLDDVVVHANAYTEEGREKAKEQYSYLSSVEGVMAKEWVVGTRYHPNDLYSDLLAMEIEEFDETGDVENRTPLFTFKEWPVENVGDGSGEFIWPRRQGLNGKYYGFDEKVLALKRAQYLNKIHFRAQYYNDPHDIDSSPIKKDQFQYYKPEYLSQKNGKWFFNNKPLNLVAAVDFAYSTTSDSKRGDSSAVVVVGVDGEHNFYVLDIDRFKTQQMSEYFKRILKLYEKWGFRKLRAEVSVAQVVIVKDLKENYIRPLGLSLTVEEYRPSRWQGSKEERILSTLEPRYANGQIWHYSGGFCQVLEDELVFANPSHDDVKDALASAIDFAQGLAPINTFRMQKANQPMIQFHSVFGGVA